MAKGIREKIKLVSSAGTGHFYTTTKNKRTKPEKMELKKYDPVVRQHVIYKEAKSNNFSLDVTKNLLRRGFLFLKLPILTAISFSFLEMLCLNYTRLKPAAAASNRISLVQPFHAVVRNGRLRWPVSEEIYRLSDQPVLSVQRRANTCFWSCLRAGSSFILGCRGACASFQKNCLRKA